MIRYITQFKTEYGFDFTKLITEKDVYLRFDKQSTKSSQNRYVSFDDLKRQFSSHRINYEFKLELIYDSN